MALPSTRNRTYDASTKVNPADLNDLQDSIVDGKVGDMELLLNGIMGAVGNDAANWDPVAGAYASSGGATELTVVIPLRKGDRIKSVEVKYYGTGVGGPDITGASLYINSTTMAQTEIASQATITDPAAAWASFILNPADTVLGSEESLVLRISVNAAGLRIGNITAIYDHP